MNDADQAIFLKGVTDILNNNLGNRLTIETASGIFSSIQANLIKISKEESNGEPKNSK